ncbi:hypothetical protein A4A58_03520 [Tardiphaga robiniae]|uniref:Uncharacterized protein n=1 Tax=Tardiphaga robiniae TaxID=943830 RepID=A0A164AYB8_9BRAD|nr:hypothetical protein A4A58_03520 [Tardiphaga robiniae]
MGPAFRALGAKHHDFGSCQRQDLIGKCVEVVSKWLGDFAALNPDKMNMSAANASRSRIPTSGKTQHSRCILRVRVRTEWLQGIEKAFLYKIPPLFRGLWQQAVKPDGVKTVS